MRIIIIAVLLILSAYSNAQETSAQTVLDTLCAGGFRRLWSFRHSKSFRLFCGICHACRSRLPAVNGRHVGNGRKSSL